MHALSSQSTFLSKVTLSVALTASKMSKVLAVVVLPVEVVARSSYYKESLIVVVDHQAPAFLLGDDLATGSCL